MNTRAPLSNRLFAPVDVAWLVYFRVVFGIVMLWEVCRYFQYDRIARYWIHPAFNFKFLYFDWVKAWPGPGMYFHFVGLGFLAVCILVGWRYRTAIVLFFLGFTYMFLLEAAQYLNHFYLLVLISFLLSFMPANASFSLDARRCPGIRRGHVPAWMLWALRAQVGLVYFFGGIAKLSSDWLQGQPLRMWLARHAGTPFVGHLFLNDVTVYIFSYGGMLFDLLVVPLLLWRRTRVFAFAVTVGFHLLNSWLFQIGIFPWFMIAATAIFFPPDWPKKCFVRVPFSRREGTPPPAPVSNAKHGGGTLRSAGRLPSSHRVMTALSIYFAIQVFLPLRHLLYPGDVNWTEEGHAFAWRMKLINKNGLARFYVTDEASQQTWTVDPAEYLPAWQVIRLQTKPDLILQFSHRLKKVFEKRGYQHVTVRAGVMVSLNGREPQLIVDPDVDLAAQAHDLAPAPWILPLTEPLPDFSENDS